MQTWCSCGVAGRWTWWLRSCRSRAPHRFIGILNRAHQLSGDSRTPLRRHQHRSVCVECGATSRLARLMLHGTQRPLSECTTHEWSAISIWHGRIQRHQHSQPQQSCFLIHSSQRPSKARGKTQLFLEACRPCAGVVSLFPTFLRNHDEKTVTTANEFPRASRTGCLSAGSLVNAMSPPCRQRPSFFYLSPVSRLGGLRRSCSKPAWPSSAFVIAFGYEHVQVCTFIDSLLPHPKLFRLASESQVSRHGQGGSFRCAKPDRRDIASF
jgi:hypothetical protein